MKTNWRGEPAGICWMCGGIRTTALDPCTRDCKDCGNHYAVFMAPLEEDEHHDPATVPARMETTPLQDHVPLRDV